eukprot:8989439-Pyramimonas_sp.AAC.1
MRMSAALASVDQETGTPQQHVTTAAVNKVVEGFRSDAFDIAMDICKDVLLTPSGIDQLALAIRISLFPIEAPEAKVFDHMHHCLGRTVSLWSRTYPEGSVDGSLSPSLLSSENLMALAATGNATTFDNIKDVWTPQHGRMHIRQKGK